VQICYIKKEWKTPFISKAIYDAVLLACGMLKYRTKPAMVVVEKTDSKLCTSREA